MLNDFTVKTYLFFTFFLITLTACENRTTTLVRQNRPKKERLKNLKDLREMMLKSTILCKQGDCPSFVGGLFSIKNEDKPDMSMCSASLIASDQILTNSHCMHGNSLEEQECQARIIFPKTDKYPLEVFECVQILNQPPRPKKPESPDWAIIKLDRTSERPPLVFNTEGLKSMEAVTLYKIDFKFDNSFFVGNVVKTHCLSNTNHILSIHSVGHQSPLFDISHCDQNFLPGNSGSAVLDKKGEMKGLFSFAPLNPDSSNLWDRIINSNINTNVMFRPPLVEKQNFGGGTNAGCISLRNEEIPDRCEFDLSVNRDLGILHAYLSRQREDPKAPSLAEKIHQMNQENYDLIRFERIDPDTDLSDFISFNTLPPMPILKSDHINEALPFIMPSFPDCIDDGAESSFTARLGVRVPDFFDKNLVFGSFTIEDYSLTVENKIKWDSFLFERNEEEGTYKMTVAGDSATSPFIQSLGLEDGHNFQLIAPFCE